VLLKATEAGGFVFLFQEQFPADESFTATGWLEKSAASGSFWWILRENRDRLRFL
jgi:hypothetical protein